MKRIALFVMFLIIIIGGVILNFLQGFWSAAIKIVIIAITCAILFYLAIKPKKVFLISPVRNIQDNLDQMEKIRAYVENLENHGINVHWPIRDTKQDGDPIGVRICRDNMLAMILADEIHVWYFEDGGFKQSTGSLFDLGIAFLLHKILGKKIILANPQRVKQTDHKSYENVLLKISGNYRG